MQGLIAEVTRARIPTGQTGLGFTGQQVPAASGKRMLNCELVTPAQQFIAFCGNGFRAGCGYRLVGDKQTGWLFKCGYARKDIHGVRTFLDDLEAVARSLDLTVAGLDPANGRWWCLESLQGLAKVLPYLSPRLDRMHLRVFGPVDVHDRIRAFIAKRRSFTTIPSSPVQTSVNAVQSFNEQIRIYLTCSGQTQATLAETIRCSRPFLSALLAGKHPAQGGAVGK